jgi:riboflavin kinase/FMN adenylyltransferase
MSVRVIRGAEQWRADQELAARRTALAIGNFDGVHLGHQEVLRRVVGHTQDCGTLSVAITFDPHPVKVLRPEHAPPLISTLEQRLEWMQELGLEAVLLLPFTKELSRLTAQEFVAQLIAGTLHAKRVFVGENFCFGHRHAGDVKLLEHLGRIHGYTVEIVPPVVLGDVVVSSTAVRRTVTDGQMDAATRLLGRPFALTGHVVPGSGIGAREVVPTLNLAADQELLPGRGVYVSETRIGGRWHRSATNVGVRPTFDAGKVAVESHLFDFDERITSGPMEVRFWKRLRPEKKFPSAQALKAQIARDLARARAYFRRADGVRRARQTV